MEKLRKENPSQLARMISVHCVSYIHIFDSSWQQNEFLKYSKSTSNKPSLAGSNTTISDRHKQSYNKPTYMIQKWFKILYETVRFLEKPHIADDKIKKNNSHLNANRLISSLLCSFVYICQAFEEGIVGGSAYKRVLFLYRFFLKQRVQCKSYEIVQV